MPPKGEDTYPGQMSFDQPDDQKPEEKEEATAPKAKEVLLDPEKAGVDFALDTIKTKKYSTPECSHATIPEHVRHLRMLEKKHAGNQFEQETFVRNEALTLARTLQETFKTPTEREFLRKALENELKNALSYKAEQDRLSDLFDTYEHQQKFVEASAQVEEIEMTIAYLEELESIIQAQKELEERQKEAALKKFETKEVLAAIGKDHRTRTIGQLSREVYMAIPKPDDSHNRKEIYDQAYRELFYHLENNFNDNEKRLLALSLIERANKILFELAEAKQHLERDRLTGGQKEELQKRISHLESDHKQSADFAEFIISILYKRKISSNDYADS